MEVLLGTWAHWKHFLPFPENHDTTIYMMLLQTPPTPTPQFVVQQIESSSITGAALSWQLHVGHSRPLSCVVYFIPVHVDYDWAINWKLTDQRSLSHLSLVFFFLNSVGTPLWYVQSVLSRYYGPSSLQHRSIMEVVLNLNSDIYWYLNYQFWWHS